MEPDPIMLFIESNVKNPRKSPGIQKETLEHLDKSVGPSGLESGLELPARRPDFAVG